MVFDKEGYELRLVLQYRRVADTRRGRTPKTWESRKSVVSSGKACELGRQLSKSTGRNG